MKARLPWAKIGACAAAAVLAILVAKGVRNALSRSGSDFTIYRQAARRLLHGGSIYAEGTFMYPPFFAILFAPLALLPVGWGAAMWGIAKAAAFAAAARAGLRLCGLRRGALRAAVAAAAGLGLLRFLDSDFTTGNANALIAALLVACVRDVAAGRRFRAGFIWAAAIAVKVTPILLLPWALRRGGRAMRAGAAVGLVLWLGAVPAAALSPAGARAAYRAWYGITIAQFNPADARFAEGTRAGGYQPGQSLRALFHRYLRPIVASAHTRAEDALRVNVADLPKGTVEIIAYGVAAGLLALWLWVGRRACGVEDACLAVAWMVLASPYSRKAHFCVLLLPALWLATRGIRDRSRAAWLGALAGAAVLGTAPALVGRRTATRLLAHSVIAWAGVLVLAALLASARGARRARGPAMPAGSAQERAS